MKLFFLKDDSLYKIFRTLQKTPPGKQLEVYIETESPFFVHERWGKQIKELLEKEKLSLVFITKSAVAKKYYKGLGLPVKYLNETGLMKMLRLLYLFFFNLKKFHLYLYTSKKNYTFYLVFFFELCIILGILYFLYGVVIPKTTIIIHPSYTVDDIVYNFRYYPAQQVDFPQITSQLAVPYQTGIVTLSHTITFSLNDVLYTTKPAKGTVRIINETIDTIPIRAGTQLITDDGRIFLTDSFVTIPAGEIGKPHFTFVSVTAATYDTSRNVIGDRGNIVKDTRLWIRKVKQSMYTKQIYADALYDFEGGQTIRKKQVATGDIALLRENLYAYMQTNKMSLIKTQVYQQKNIVLPFPDLFVPVQTSFVYSIPHILTGSAIISGTLTQDYLYYYVAQKDLLVGFETFLRERKSEAQTIVSLQPDTIFFLEKIPSIQTGIFIISTKIPLIQGYNFIQDPNRLLEDLKDKLPGLPLQEARQHLLDQPTIGTIEIHVSPPRYQTIAKLKSRIFFEIEK